ncbi:MAG: hypothetical protein JSR79_02355, partial [Proteobacteria bacterium]|nr:hypothetical protein [Pseudomonadota bacterium]
PATITLADIVEAIEGPIAMTACVDHGAHDCCVEQSCKVKPHWNAVNGAVRGALAGIALSDLARFPGESRGPGVSGPILDPGFRRGSEVIGA